MSLCLGQEIFPHAGIIKEGSILSLSADDRTYYPIGLTFPEVIRWYYGIREVKTSSSMNFLISASGGGGNSGSLLVSNIESDPISNPSSWDGPFIGPLRREEDYLYEGNGEYRFSNGSNFMTSSVDFYDMSENFDLDGFFHVSAFVEIRARIFDSSYYEYPLERASIIKDGGLYYPRIDIGFHLVLKAASDSASPSGYSEDELQHRYFSGPTPDPGGWSSSSINVNVFGKSFTLDGWTDNTSYSTGSGATSSISGSLGSIDITASKWWPYDPGDGLGPIWDEDTGAKLRNKF